MTNLRTAAQQALEALKMMRDEYGEANCPACAHADAAVYALNDALAEPEYPLGQATTDVGVPVYVVKKAEPVQEPVLTVDALRVEFERRYRGKLGITRVEGGVYLSPAIETEWQQFVRKYTSPPQRPAEPVQEPVQEPVAWTGYDLDGMVEAFSRVIEAHHSSKHPFHNPIDMDAKIALRILRGFIPAMKAYATPLQRKPLTEEEIHTLRLSIPATTPFLDAVVLYTRAVEAAHGIK